MPSGEPDKEELRARPEELRRQLRNISAHPTAQTPDAKTQEEERDLDLQKQAAEVSGIVQDIEERKTYAKRIFILLVVWLIAIGVILFLQGFHVCCFSLPTSVILALIGSTTGGVVSIFLIVTRYLFPKRL